MATCLDDQGNPLYRFHHLRFGDIGRHRRKTEPVWSTKVSDNLGESAHCHRKSESARVAD